MLLIEFNLDLDESHEDGFFELLYHLSVLLLDDLLDEFHEVFDKQVFLDLGDVAVVVAFSGEDLVVVVFS